MVIEAAFGAAWTANGDRTAKIKNNINVNIHQQKTE